MAEKEIASFAAGCFWGVEARFRELDGVLDAAVGYMGGQTENPTYKDVCSGRTGHAEAVQLTFDPAIITYQQLLEEFFGMHNPTTINRQGPDHGTQYRSAIYYHDDDQKIAALKKIDALGLSDRWRDPIVTQVEPAPEFWRAEEYHQRYLEKNGAAHCSV
ncbi:MAG TPA: peptide-methionine (S)-S-oxide reductase MsrA [Xanthomonadales bacterium]|nr:peptide-methionine (S)-S-oxide reductase MsrA [Xanthomonadales bacterium]